MRRQYLLASSSLAAIFVACTAYAQQSTEIYTYDALGRLIKVEVSGGSNDDQVHEIEYDDAGNRVSYEASGAAVPPSISISDASAAEGGALSFPVTLSSSYPASITMNYATAYGSAGSADFTAKSGTLTFTAGQTSKTITVSSKTDNLIESTENFRVNLSNASSGATFSDSQGNGNILDDPPDPPSIAIGNASATEGGTLSFPVTLSSSYPASITMSYATANGSAGTADYTAKSGTLTFSAGQTSKTITVSSKTDNLIESTENFRVNLSNASSGATFSDSQGNGNILDDPPPNNPPNTTTDNVSGQCLTLTTVNLTANDSDPEGNTPLTLVSINKAAGSASATVISGSTVRVVFGGSGDFSTFFYTVRDSLGATSTGQLNAWTSSCTGGGPIF